MYIDDPSISDEKKALFGTLLEILDEIDRVCSKNDIKYFAFAGTLLGAVRHKGFIPWDDDIDLLMLRKDYDKFIRRCETDLSSDYALQTTLNEEGYYKYQARVRKNGTTCFTSTEINKIKKGINIPYNCGVFISIFPLDTVPDSRIKRVIQRRSASIRNRILRSYMNNTSSNIKTCITRTYCKIAGHKNIYKRLSNSFSKYSKKTGEFVHFPVLYSFAPITSYYSADFSNVTYLPFEDRMIPCPAGYSRCLSRPFGNDYMTPPPIAERGNHSHGQYINLKKGYKDILKMSHSDLLALLEEVKSDK